MVWPALIQAGGAIGASLISADAAKGAEGDAKNMQKRVYRKSKLWRKAGKRGLKEYENLLRAGPGEFKPEEDPGFEYGYKRYVENPLLRSASVRKRLFDPSTQKALTMGASDYASTKYDNFLRRYYEKLQPHFQLSEAGRLATMQSGATAAGLVPYAQQAQYGQANALAAGVASLSNIAGKTIDYYGTQNILNQASNQPSNQPTKLSNARWSPRTEPGY